MFLCIDSFIDSFIAVRTMENLRNSCTVDLVTSEEKLKKLAVQLSFKQFKIFNKNLVAVEQAKVELTLNQPIYVGFAILDLSRKYPDSTLLLTDTDSLTYQLKQVTCTETFILISICSIFHMYEKEDPFYDGEHKKVIGKM